MQVSQFDGGLCDNNGRCLDRNLFSAYYSSYLFAVITLHFYNSYWFPNLTRAYDNNGRCPRQKLVFGILQLHNFTNYYSDGQPRFKGVLDDRACQLWLVGFPI